MLRRVRGRVPETLVALGLILGFGVAAGIVVARQHHGAAPLGTAPTATAPAPTTAPSPAPSPAPPPATAAPPPPPAAPQELRVASLAPGAASLSWRTTVPTVARLALGPPSLGPTRWLPPTPSRADHEVMVTGLAVGVGYRVWLASTAADGESEQATLDLTAPPLAQSQTSPSVGAGDLRLDGQPWFPFMVYGGCSAYYGSTLDSGITLFAANPCGGLQSQLDALAGRALSAGVAGEPSGDGPGLIGTFYPDEADGHGYTGSLLPQLPPGLGFLTLTNHFYSGATPLPGGRTVYPSLVARADVIGFDLYPLQGWCQANRLGDVYAAQRELVRLAGGKPTFQWIEAAGMNCPTDPALAITPQTVRTEAWLAVVGGAHGLGFFPAAWTADVGAEIARISTEVAALTPALLDPPLEVSVEPAGSSVRLAAWAAGGALYVAAVNAAATAARVTLRLPGLDGRPLDVLEESRQVAAQGDAVTDDFGPLAVHLYVARPPGT